MYIPINLITLVYYFQILFPVQRVANFAVIGSLKLVFSQKTNLLTCLLNDDVQFNTNEFPLRARKTCQFLSSLLLGISRLKSTWQINVLLIMQVLSRGFAYFIRGFIYGWILHLVDSFTNAHCFSWKEPLQLKKLI